MSTRILLDIAVFDHDTCARLPRILIEPSDHSEAEVHTVVEQALHDLVASPFYSTPVLNPEGVQCRIPMHMRIYQSLKRAIGVA